MSTTVLGILHRIHVLCSPGFGDRMTGTGSISPPSSYSHSWYFSRAFEENTIPFRFQGRLQDGCINVLAQVGVVGGWAANLILSRVLSWLTLESEKQILSKAWSTQTLTPSLLNYVLSITWRDSGKHFSCYMPESRRENFFYFNINLKTIIIFIYCVCTYVHVSVHILEPLYRTTELESS